jgi:hypothetical protein
MNRMIALSGAAAVMLGFAGEARAHTLYLDCYNVKGQVVACQGSFSDGSIAAGAPVTLYTESSEKLGSGTTDEHGVYLFKAPSDEYIVVIGIGPAHVSNLASPDISASPHRPGWNADWVPALTVDRLDKLQQWQDQFLAEKGPLVEKIEEQLTK